MAKDIAATKQPRTVNSGAFAKRKKTIALLSMVAPGAIWLFLIRYIPMFGIVLAFKNYKVYTKAPTFINNLIHSEWCGFDNFKFMFKTKDAIIMFRNTLLYNIVFIVLGLVIAVAFAVMMNEITNKFMAKTYQTDRKSVV